MTVTERLAELLLRPVLERDRARAALLVLDWTGCAVGALGEPFAAKALARDVPKGRCSRVGAPPTHEAEAAYGNGLLGNVLEMDDLDARAVLHAAPTVIPAALAVAETSGASAEALLDAVVRGYEATIRVGRAVGSEHYRHFHNTATCGPFGAAVAAADLLGTDVVAALGMAGTTAGGLWQTRLEPDSDAKQVHAAQAAWSGVRAARLAEAGLEGPRAILEGEHGFFAALCPGGDPEDVLEDYGGWLIHETTVKPYPACRHAHPAIDAALLFQPEWDGGDVTVHTYAEAVRFCDTPCPRTPLEAKFSIQHMVAVCLLHGRAPALDDFAAARIDDPEVAALRGRISVAEDPALTRAFPQHYGARIGHHLVRDAAGDPANSLPREAVVEKARGLMSHGGMAAGEADALVEAALNLAEGGGLDAYFAAWPRGIR